MYAPEHAGIATPIGAVVITAQGDMLTRVTIGDGLTSSAGSSALLRCAINQVEAWFAGERRGFDLPIAPVTSPRGLAMRQAIISIGYGETISYGALAQSIGSGARAIGQACARNPLPIIVPCHRVLAANGVLGAYSAGDGPVTKAWLLAQEQRFLSINGCGEQAPYKHPFAPRSI